MSVEENKAKELVDKFIGSIPHWGGDPTQAKQINTGYAKRCALIAIEEIIKVVPFVDKKHAETIEQYRAAGNQFLSYWYKVKDEIQKL